MKISKSGAYLRPYAVMAAVCLIFYAAWASGLAQPALTGDEAFVAQLTRQGARATLARLNADEPHPPLYYLSMVGWRSLIAREHEFLLRLPSVFAGVMALSVAFRLGRALGLSAWSALGAAALLGLNPQFGVHVREARMYAPMLLSIAVATLLTLHTAQGRAPLWAAALAGLVALLTHYFNALYIAALGVWGTFALTGRARRNWVAAQGLIWATLIAWLFAFGTGFFNPTNLSQGKTWSLLLPPWEALARLAAVGAVGYRGYEQTPLAYVATPLLIGGWLLGCRLSRGHNRWLLASLVAGPLLAYTLIGMSRPVFHPKYTLPWLLFALLAWGQVIQRGRWPGLALSAALAACFALPMWDTLRRPYEPGLFVSSGDQLTGLPRDLGRSLLAIAGPEDVFGLTTPDPAHCYYTQHYFERDLGCALLPAYPNQPVDELAADVDELLAQHRVLWLLDFNNPAWDPSGAAAAALDRRALLLGRTEIAGRGLKLYAAPATVQRESRPIAARVDDFAELESAWLLHAQDLYVILRWRSLAERPAVNGKVFVHLLDADGNLITQSDGLPAQWSRPFETWRLGEVIFDAHTLRLPPGTEPALATVRMGVYDANTLERFALVQEGRRLADDAVTLPLKP